MSASRSRRHECTLINSVLFWLWLGLIYQSYHYLRTVRATYNPNKSFSNLSVSRKIPAKIMASHVVKGCDHTPSFGITYGKLFQVIANVGEKNSSTIAANSVNYCLKRSLRGRKPISEFFYLLL